MARSGFKLVGQRQIPRARKYIRDILNKTGGHQAQLDHYATEWTNNKGQKALVTLIKIAMQQPLLTNDSMVMWLYSLDYVFVDASEFDKTIEALLDATESTKENPHWKHYTNLLAQQRAQKAAQDHRIHMRNRQAAFDAHQQKMKGIWAAQDANHASFMNRNFGTNSSTAQRQFVNMINEEETVYNPTTGKNYQVNAGALQYWMDSDGNYIENNNLFYNPNGDINLNSTEWIKVRKAF
jgi:alpha-D-ribose 1-methylphosphonate 5-triphosphate diphosphatase PhnM